MFHSAAVRLTAWYLGIVMILSISASWALYNVSSNDLEQNARRQIGYFRGLIGPDNASDFASLRQRQLNEDLRHLKTNLIFFNLLVFIGGGAASYGLARRTLKPIEAALISQSRFAGDASHELRTPLTAIQTENEVALRNPKLTRSQAVELLKSNLEEVGKLKALSEGLLALTAAAGDEILDTEISLMEIIDGAKDRIQKAASIKEIHISSSLNDPKIKVKGSQQRLTDLIAILLDNAVKYSSKNMRIVVSAERRGKNIRISVADNGPGIKKSDLEHIFERFYRADSSRTKQKVSGYGLGLAIAKRIVELHNGSIEVKTSPKGSTFVVNLPN